MTTRTLAEVLESVRRLLEAKTLDVGGDSRRSDDPPNGPVPNPLYAPLLALVRDVRTARGVLISAHPPARMSITSSGPEEPTLTAHIPALAYWQDAPDGALRGSLEDAMPVGVALSRVREQCGQYHMVLATPSASYRVPGGDDQAALEVVEAYLKETT